MNSADFEFGDNTLFISLIAEMARDVDNNIVVGTCPIQGGAARGQTVCALVCPRSLLETAQDAVESHLGLVQEVEHDLDLRQTYRAYLEKENCLMALGYEKATFVAFGKDCDTLNHIASILNEMPMHNAV